MPPEHIQAWASFVVVVGAAAAAVGAALAFGWRYAIRPELRRQMEGVMKELLPNGGGSLRDAVDRIERRLDAHLEVAAEDHADFRKHLEGR